MCPGGLVAMGWRRWRGTVTGVSFAKVESGDGGPSGNGGSGTPTSAPTSDSGGGNAPTGPGTAPTSGSGGGNAPSGPGVAPTNGSGGGNAPTGPGASALTGTSGFNEDCGKENGQVCEEGLSCLTIQSCNLCGSQKAVCFRLAAEGAACETDERQSSLGDFQSGNRRFRNACAPGLLCVNALCVPDDGRVEECNPGRCQRQGEICNLSPGVCEKVVPFGTACSVGQICDKGPYRTASACIDGLCRSIANLEQPCGEDRVCATRAQRAEFFFQDGQADLSCQEGFCGEVGDGGLFKVCSDGGECAASGWVFARSQEGASRCMDVVSTGSFFGPDCPVDTPPTDYARINDLTTSTCGEGLFCEPTFLPPQRGIDRGVCIQEGLVPVGGTCAFDKRCVETDGTGGDVFCERLESSNDGVCKVDSDADCAVDSDCNGAEGQTCVKPPVAYGNRKRCWKYNQQPGQSCVTDDAFGQVHDEACAEGLYCYEDVGDGGRGSTTGRCVRFVEDGEICNPEESVLCRGQQFEPVRSVCNNGTCRQFTGPYE